jgi:magnesium-protoporphyrin IX monomethyl ester (oxidative) cyclase
MAAAMACTMGAAVAMPKAMLEATPASSFVSQRVSFAGPISRKSALVAFGVGNRSARVSMAAAGASVSKGGKQQKKEIDETLLTPRFYTTDFDEMERLFNVEINKNLNEAEFEALAAEFKADYNQTHFVRNPEFKAAADKLQGPLRQIFVEFLERSCTAEFSGFLLYKELGRRLKVNHLSYPFLGRLLCSILSNYDTRGGDFCMFV